MTKLQSFFSADEWKTLQKRSAIIPMGVNLPTTADPSVKHTKRVKKTIVFIGRLVEKKGVQYLLPAFKELLSRNKNTHLTIGGDGPMLTSLKKQTESLGISNAVTFSGYVTGTAKKELLSSADVYVVPSIIADDGDAEGLPVSLLEGLAYGKICIATNESGGDDILTNGKSGFLIPQKDTLAIVETLERALSLDDSSRVKMSAQAQEVAKNFSWQRIAERYYSFLLKD